MVEVLIAIFFLSTGIVLVSQLLQRSLRIHQQGVHKAAATNLALSTLAQIRQWASLPGNFRSDWSFWQDRLVSDPDDGRYSALVKVQPLGRKLQIPATSLEAPFAPLDNHLQRSLIPVRVTAAWGPGAQETVRLFSYVAAPRYPLDATSSTQVGQLSGTSPLPRDANAQFSGSLSDNLGHPIEDVVLHWYLAPITGNARINPGLDSRTGSTITIQNRFRLPIGVDGYLGGSVGVRCLARYWGQWVGNGPLDQNPTTVLDISP